MFHRLLLIHVIAINLYCQNIHKFRIPHSNSLSFTYSDNTLFEVQQYSTVQTNILVLSNDLQLHVENTYLQTHTQFYKRSHYNIALGGTYYKESYFLYQNFSWNPQSDRIFDELNQYRALLQINFAHKLMFEWNNAGQISYLYLHKFKHGIGLSLSQSDQLGFEWIFQSPHYLLNLEYLPKNQIISMGVQINLTPKFWAHLILQNSQDLYQEKEYTLHYLYSIQ